MTTATPTLRSEGRMVSLRIMPSTLAAIDEVAAAKGLSRSEFLIRAASNEAKRWRAHKRHYKK